MKTPGQPYPTGRRNNGRPFIDLRRLGLGRRSLLYDGESAPYPDDDEVARRAVVFVTETLPALVAHEKNKPRTMPRRIQRVDQAPAHDTIAHLISWYLDRHLVSLQRSPNTIAQYRRQLFFFENALNEVGVRTIEQLERQPSAVGHFRHKHSEQFKPQSTRNALVVCRSFIRCAGQNFPAIEDAAIRIINRDWRPPRVAPATHEAPPREDILKVLEYTRTWPSPFARPARFIILTGWRPIDTVNLEWRGIDADKRTAAVLQQKTKQHLHVHLSDAAMAVINEVKPAGQYVFTDRNGQKMTNTHLAERIATVCRLAGVNASAKSFRVAVVTELTERGFDRDVIRQLTGHTSDAIAKYIRLRSNNMRHLAETYAATLADENN